jgi:hypothetical protein
VRYGPACGPELATLSAKRSAPGQHDRASLFLVDLLEGVLVARELP